MKYGYVVDIGATNIRVGISDNSVSNNRPICNFHTPDNRTDIIDSIVWGLNKCIKLYPNYEKYIAVSCPGIVNKGTIEKALYIDLAGVNLSQTLKHFFNEYTIIIENDANFQAFGRFAKYSLLYLAIGSAVGGAYIGNSGKLFKGAHNSACECGHIFIGSNITCRCGRNGCLDTVISGQALIERFGHGWWHKKEHNIDEYLVYCGEITEVAVETMTAILDPTEICICGNICSNPHFKTSFLQHWENNKWPLANIDFQTDSWPFVVDGANKIINKVKEIEKC